MEPPAPTLSESERILVTALLDDSSSRARRRARILLEAADGQEPTQIARSLNTRTRTVYLALSIFEAKRLDLFSAAARKRVQTRHSTASPPAPDELTAHSTMRRAAHEVLAHQYSKLVQVEDEVRAARDIEAVHDMRVACRRLNSAFRLFRDYLPGKRVKRLRGVLEELRDDLGELRNLDVLGDNLQAYCAAASDADKPQLGALEADWQLARANIHAALVELLDSDKIKAWRKRMDAFLEHEKADHTARIDRVLPSLLWEQYGRVRAYDIIVPGATLEQLHALRIDIKRLRYSLEFFRDVLASGMAMEREAAKEEISATLIKPLVALQDLLGEIQDAVVASRALTDYIGARANEAEQEGAAAPDFRAIAAYHAFRQERISELRQNLPERWQVILDAPFRARLAQATASF